MTTEERVLQYAIAQIEETAEECNREYNERMAECYAQAADEGKNVEEVVCDYLLEEQIFRAVDDERNYWVKRLEAQGASLETIRKIDPDYEPETEAPWYNVDSGYRAVLD